MDHSFATAAAESGGTDTLAGAARPADTHTHSHMHTHTHACTHTRTHPILFFPLRHRRAQTHSDSVVCVCVWRGGEETATSAHRAVSFNHFLSFVCFFFVMIEARHMYIFLNLPPHPLLCGVTVRIVIIGAVDVGKSVYFFKRNTATRLR